METSEVLFYGLLGAVFLLTQYVAWKRLLGGFLIVRAYSNYRGKYCATGRSPLVVVLRNNSAKEQVVEKLDFLDHARNFLYTVKLSEENLRFGVSTGIDIGNTELQFRDESNPTSFVKAVVSNGNEYIAKIREKRWYHI